MNVEVCFGLAAGCDGLKRLRLCVQACFFYDKRSVVLNKEFKVMKTVHKTLLIAAMLGVPFAAAQAHDNEAEHRAWLKAQQIDIKPTLNITETQIPADGTTTTTPSSTTPSYGTPGASSPGSSMPSTEMPSTQTPSTQTPSSPGSYTPMPAPGAAPGATEGSQGMNSGMGTQR